jgi:hypothetical protein
MWVPRATTEPPSARAPPGLEVCVR